METLLNLQGMIFLLIAVESWLKKQELSQMKGKGV